MDKETKKAAIEKVAAYLRDKVGLSEGTGWLTKRIATNVVNIVERVQNPKPRKPPISKCVHNYKHDFSASTWTRYTCTKCGDAFTQDRD